MLSAPSPYSPFFTSGLLFEGFLPSSSPCVEEVGPRRGSLPNDMPPTHCGTSQRLQSPSDVSSAFYFTLQPRRDTSALRSFLSLDLAESQSIRTASLRRSDSTVTKTTRSSRTYVPHHSTQFLPPSPLRPLIRRTSGEQLRPIPSPKPVPLTSPPDVPTFKSSGPPVLPPIVPSPRLSFIPELHDFAPVTPMTATSLASSTFPPPSTPSNYSVTSAERRVSREDALASLEGRADEDFMDMSDDEDEDEDGDQVATAIEEEEVVIISAPPPPRKSPGRPTRKAGSTMESWFPLVSFIDFKDDDTSPWNWRNFIEVGGVL